MAILRNRLTQPGGVVNCPAAARTLATLQLAGRDRECFVVFFFDALHRVIASEEITQGTLLQTSVYPREVVRAALRHNAAAVILAHNHPSGATLPSEADIALTVQLKQALAMVCVTTLDHLIVAGDNVASFAELGLM